MAQNSLPQDPKVRNKNVGLYTVAGIKFAKMLLLLVVATGLFYLLKIGPADFAEKVMNVLHIEAESHLWERIMTFADTITPRRVAFFGFGFLAYALLNCAQGIGVLLQKKWAAFVIIAEDFILIPLEIFEMFRHFTLHIFVVFVINVVIAVLVLKNWSKFKGPAAVENNNLSEMK